jgi:flavin reductase (DIM6/NTAB) family NADH-FMN oxidoreductase RutF
MNIDPAEHSDEDNYKLLTNLIVPRPIAWVTTVGKTGVVNLAPYSFFNAVSSDPPCVVVSIGLRADGAAKDTGANIELNHEFVVNMVTEDLLSAMNVSAADFPADQSEAIAANLPLAASLRIGAPRLTDAQVSLECKWVQSVAVGSNTLVIGEIVMFHIADQLLGSRLHIDGFAPLGRLGSPSMYSRTTDRFALPRISYADWQRGRRDAD